jgi:hypothetical protein
MDLTRQVLDISVASNGRSLSLNGKDIYPQSAMGQQQNPIYVPQVPSSVNMKTIEATPEKYLAHPLLLESFSALITESHDGQTQQEVVRVELGINKLEGKSISIPNLVITAIKGPDGNLMLTSIDKTEAAKNSECTGRGLFCKWKSVLGNLMGGMSTKMDDLFSSAFGKSSDLGVALKMPKMPKKGCHHHGKNKGGWKVFDHGMIKGLISDGKAKTMDDASGLHHHKKPAIKPGVHHYKPHHKGKPSHKQSHTMPQTTPAPTQPHHHHEHGPLHKMFHKVAASLLTIVVPIGIGILAGLVTYLLGMAIGTLIALVWISFRQSTYSPIALGSEGDEVYFEYDDEISEADAVEKEEGYEAYGDGEGWEAPPLYVEVEGRELRP